jgi:hypothetical protein
MRPKVALLILLCIASCSRAPGSLGITGPGTTALPAPPIGGAATIDENPADRGIAYKPSMVPNEGGGTRFYGYD